MTRTSADKDGR